MLSYGSSAKKRAANAAYDRRQLVNRKGPSTETPEDVRKRAGDKTVDTSKAFSAELPDK